MSELVSNKPRSSFWLKKNDLKPDSWRYPSIILSFVYTFPLLELESI